MTIKALGLVDAIPLVSPDTVTLAARRLNRRKLVRGKEWAIPLTGPDGNEYLLPFKLMKAIAAKDIRERKSRALREGPVTAESLGVSELHGDADNLNCNRVEKNYYYLKVGKTSSPSSPSSPVFIARHGETAETLETMFSLL